MFKRAGADLDVRQIADTPRLSEAIVVMSSVILMGFPSTGRDAHNRHPVMPYCTLVACTLVARLRAGWQSGADAPAPPVGRSPHASVIDPGQLK
jgi:hypothetical protein